MGTSIELRHLRHFIALAEELHFGRAAKRCGISQPPFSVSIRQLEDALGTPLVMRGAQKIRLTAAGTAFHAEALKVVTQLERAQSTALLVGQGLEGRIAVGFFASMLYRGLDRAVTAFREEHPRVGLGLIELSTADQIPALVRGRIDYAFVHAVALPEGVESQPLLDEPFVLCLPADHPRAALERIRLADVAGEDFVLFSRSFSPAYFDQVVSLCVAAGFHPEVRHEARHWLTVLACVSRGLGITLVPRSLSRSGVPGLSYVAIEEAGVAGSVVRGAWLRGEGGNPALRAWHRVVLREIRA